MRSARMNSALSPLTSPSWGRSQTLVTRLIRATVSLWRGGCRCGRWLACGGLGGGCVRGRLVRRCSGPDVNRSVTPQNDVPDGRVMQMTHTFRANDHHRSLESFVGVGPAVVKRRGLPGDDRGGVGVHRMAGVLRVAP